MKVTWEVEDGYVGKSSPQYTDIPDDELADCETREDREALVREYVQEDFENKITWELVTAIE